MSDKFFKRGDEIIISIKNSSTGNSASSSSQRKAPAFGSRLPSSYLARRKKSKKGNLNFYDLGEYLSGSAWIDDQKSIVPTVTQMNDVLINGDPVTRFEDFLELFLDEILAQYNDKPAATNLADWKTNFRRFSRADGSKLGLSVYDQVSGSESLLNQSNPNWTDSGYRIGADQDFESLEFSEGLFPGGLYNFLVLGSMHVFPNIFQSGIRITAALNFGSVEIDPSTIQIDSQKEINFYLSRRLRFPVFYYLKNIGSGFRIDSFLNYSFFAITRRNSIESLLDVKRANSSGLIWDAVKHYARIDEAREIHANYNPDGSTNSFAAPVPASATYTDFAQDADGIRIPATDGAIDYGSLQLPFDYAISGCLLGAINQENDWFFIWKA